jgi:cytokinesis protein
MDTIFRSKKSSTRTSQSSSYSTPYAQVSAGPSPVAGPSNHRRDTAGSSTMSAHSNPSLTHLDDRRDTLPMPPPKDYRPPPAPEFGPRPSRDSDAGSIRSVASKTSFMPSTDLGRYPSFSAESTHSNRPSYPSRARPSGGVSRVSEEFLPSRPPDPQIEQEFQRLLENRDSHMPSKNVPSITSRSSVLSVTDISKSAASLTVDQKWQMVKADAQGRWDAARLAEQRKEEEVRSGKKRSGAIKNSPEWFLKKLLDGTVTAQHIQMLTVAIRTSPLE